MLDASIVRNMERETCMAKEAILRSNRFASRLKVACIKLRGRVWYCGTGGLRWIPFNMCLGHSCWLLASRTRFRQRRSYRRSHLFFLLASVISCSMVARSEETLEPFAASLAAVLPVALCLTTVWASVACQDGLHGQGYATSMPVQGTHKYRSARLDTNETDNQ